MELVTSVDSMDKSGFRPVELRHVGRLHKRCRRIDYPVCGLESNTQGAFMKFYDCASAPSPRRVRIFLAEKGLIVPTVQVDLRDGEQFTPVVRALNPDCMVPVLELDSGAVITDIIAICRYFEELHPD